MYSRVDCDYFIDIIICTGIYFKVMMTRDGQDRMIELRSRPVSNSSYLQAGAALCQYYPNCRNGPNCPQAHGKLELAYWNGEEVGCILLLLFFMCPDNYCDCFKFLNQYLNISLSKT